MRRLQLKEQRASGVMVEKTDLLLEWLHHAKQLEASLKEKEQRFDAQVPGAKPLSPYEQEQLMRLRNKWASFERKAQNRADFCSEISKRLGAKLLKPQRLCNLTTEEEAHRFKCTLQCFDELM